MSSNTAKKIYMFMVYGFLYTPIIILIVYSFNSSMYTATGWEGFSLQWYKKLFNNNQLMQAAVNSLVLAAVSATLATMIGTLGAVSFFRFNFFGKNFLYTMLYIVMMSPDVVMGISLLVLFLVVKLPLGFTTLLITHITFSLPFVVITLFTRLAGFDKHLVEASKDLGADELRTFIHIILPMLMPAVFAGWLMSFTISLDDVIGSSFVAGDFQILPLEIYSMVRLGVKPEVNALSTLMFSLSLLFVVGAQLLLREKKSKNRP